MQAEDIINYEIPALKPTDTAGFAIELMSEFKCSVLPVVEAKSFLGTIDEDFLLSFDDSTVLTTIPLKNFDLQAKYNTSLIQVVDYLLEKELSILPIYNEEDLYLGAVYAVDAFAALAENFYSGNGAVLELKLGLKDYSLSEISRIVENEGVNIQKLFVSNKPDVGEEGFSVFIKFNKKDISAVISSLKRFGYKVSMFDADLALNDLDKDRYQMLMKYLDV